MFQPQDILQEHYQLQRTLGHTAAGHQTWLAVDLKTQEKVTIKLLAFSPQMRWEELKLFEREAQILQTLNHPRIPRYRDYFDIDKELGGGVPWFALVQDYIAGFSLQELLAQGKHFSEKQVRSIAQEILQILIYLHELSPPVLHRDIKPSNLILGEDKRIYLIDFGAVQAQASVTGVTFTVVGTSGYAPLEQFWGRAVAASDLYALGATLIHLLTGIAPADLPQKDSRIQFRDRISLESDFTTWIEKITDIAIEKRFLSAREALEILQSRKLAITRTNPNRNISQIKINKPFHTKIKLGITSDKLKVSLPAPGLKRFARLGCAGLFFGFYFLTFITGILVALLSNISVSTLLVAVIFITIMLPFVSIYFGEITHLESSDNRVIIERQTFKFFYGKKTESIANIIGVFVQQYGSTYDLKLRTRGGTINLGGTLKDDECFWLAQELQDWFSSEQKINNEGDH